MFVYTVLAISGLYLFFDVSYFLRGAYMWLRWTVATSNGNVCEDLLKDSVVDSICWTTDLDFMMHMNNARYMRECDFARFKLWFETGIWGVLKRVHGSMVVASSTIRHRKPVQFLQRFQVRSRVLCWDERSFYVEQRIERVTDRFICSIVLLKQIVTGVTLREVLEAKYGHNIPTSPEFPEEVKLFIECHKKSSEKLRGVQ